jgi:phosphate transport system permease protein
VTDVAVTMPMRVRSVSGVRRMKDRAFSIFVWACGAIALAPLVVIAAFVFTKGVGALSVNFFTQVPAGPLDPASGGIAEAFVGTAIIVGLATALAVPLGVLTAAYLSEFGRGRFADTVRLVSEILLSTPSIIIGLFVYEIVVTATKTFSALAGGLAIAVLMWPIVTRATEEVLRLVPTDVREAALALGYPRWRMILRVVIPTAGAGILTAVMLALSRGIGETAPILVTALGSDYMNTVLTRPTDAVPLKIYAYARQPIEALQNMAWSAALTLLVVVLVLSIGARFITARRRRRLG